MMSWAETAKNFIEKTVDTKESTSSFDVVKQLSNLESTITNGTQLNMFKELISTEKNENIKNKASESMGKIGNILNIQVPFLGSIWALFGTKRPIEVLGSKEHRNSNKFLNGVLKFFGFPKGMEDLHESYITEQLKWVDMQFSKDCFTEYKKGAMTPSSDAESTRSICGLDKTLWSLKTEEKEKIKAKIPENFANIKETLTKKFSNNIGQLNINTVRMVDPSLIITENKKEIIDISKIQGQEDKFIDEYIKITVNAFAQSGDEFINSDNINPDTFALAVFGNLTGEKFFVEGVNLGLISANSTNETTKTNNIEADPNQAAKIKAELDTVKNAPITPEMIISASTKYNVPTTYIMAIMKNDSSYGTAGKWARTHNPGNVGNTDDGSTKDRGTREAGVDAVAQNIARRIEEYQKIYGNSMPTIKQIAQNQWPDGKGFLSNQWNFKKANPNSIGAYMTSKQWQERVQDIAQNLTQEWISNERVVA